MNNMEGYPTTDKCEECGCIKDNFIEPRFGYVTCQDCKNIAPTDRKRKQ